MGLIKQQQQDLQVLKSLDTGSTSFPIQRIPVMKTNQPTNGSLDRYLQ